MSTRLTAAALAAFLCHAGVALAAPPQSTPLPDWPCGKVDAEPLTAAALLPGSAPALASGAAHDAAAWQQDDRVRSVVDYAAAPENVPDLGVARITAFAHDAGAARATALPLVLDGIAARTNQLRAFIRDGVTDKVAQSHVLADEVAANDQALAALPADAPKEQRAALEAARRRNRAAISDRAEDAELLCHRLDYTARKARRFGTVIAELSGAH